MGRTPLLEHFSALEDPRQSWNVVYPLPEVLLLVKVPPMSTPTRWPAIRCSRCSSHRPAARRAP